MFVEKSYKFKSLFLIIIIASCVTQTKHEDFLDLQGAKSEHYKYFWNANYPLGPGCFHFSFKNILEDNMKLS